MLKITVVNGRPEKAEEMVPKSLLEDLVAAVVCFDQVLELEATMQSNPPLALHADFLRETLNKILDDHGIELCEEGDE